MRAPFYPKDTDLLDRFVVDALKAGDRAGGGHLTVAHYDMEEKLPLIKAPDADHLPDRGSVRGVREAAPHLPQARMVDLPARHDPGARSAAG